MRFVAGFFIFFIVLAIVCYFTIGKSVSWRTRCYGISEKDASSWVIDYLEREFDMGRSPYKEKSLDEIYISSIKTYDVVRGDGGIVAVISLNNKRSRELIVEASIHEDCDMILMN